MTDKQKEAIENVKKQLEGIKKANECGLATRGEFNKDIEAIETVLNLIQTQQAEIEKKDKESHFIQSELDKSNAEIIKLKRIIDEMANYIGEIDDETFCDEDKYERDIEDNVIGCDEDCQECVRLYFERKVETEDK